MIYTFRIERLCIGYLGQEDGFFQTQKAVNQAFAKLGMVVEQMLKSGPMLASSVSSLFTLDGLDVRVDSQRDALTIRNLVASVVSDVNVANPGLNLSLITRSTQGGKYVQCPPPSGVEAAEDFTSLISVEEDDDLALLANVAAPSPQSEHFFAGR